jgi:uncharacterized membrane protein YgcG
MSFRLLVAAALLFAASPIFAQAPVPPAPAGSFVSDAAALLTASERAAIEEIAARSEREDGVRLAVLTLQASKGEEPKSIAVRTLNAWNVGRRSVLLLVVMDPRKLYVQPGTDLAPLFDETTASSICSSVVAPKMRSGDRAGAIRAGLEAIRARVKTSVSPSGATGTPRPLAAPRPPEPVHSSAGSALLGFTILGGIFGVVALAIGGVCWAIFKTTRRPCQRCGAQLSRQSRTVTPATEYATGAGETVDSCGRCGFFEVAPFVIPVVTASHYDSSSDTSSYSSSDTSSYSSGSDSWSSSSDSSSSSSSDGSGGGGSDW